MEFFFRRKLINFLLLHLINFSCQPICNLFKHKNVEVLYERSNNRILAMLQSPAYITATVWKVFQHLNVYDRSSNILTMLQSLGYITTIVVKPWKGSKKCSARPTSDHSGQKMVFCSFSWMPLKRYFDSFQDVKLRLLHFVRGMFAWTLIYRVLQLAKKFQKFARYLVKSTTSWSEDRSLLAL